MINREYDLIIFGATGFTGKLICDYISKHKDSKNKDNIWRLKKSAYGLDDAPRLWYFESFNKRKRVFGQTCLIVPIE